MFLNVCALSGVIKHSEPLQTQSRSGLHSNPQKPQSVASDLGDITSWLQNVIPALECSHQAGPAGSIEDMAARAQELMVKMNNRYSKWNDSWPAFVLTILVLQEMQEMFAHYKSVIASVNLQAQETPDLQEGLVAMNRDWSRACAGLQQRDTSLRKMLMHCQVRENTRDPLKSPSAFIVSGMTYVLMLLLVFLCVF